MAAAGDDLEHLECPICYNIMTEPKMLLPCQHTYCKACLEQHLVASKKNRVTMECPECRGEIHLSDAGVAGLPTHRSLEQQIQKLKRSSCYNCKRVANLALCHGHCNRSLCEDCTGLHLAEMRHTIHEAENICSNRIADVSRLIEDESRQENKINVDDVTELCNEIIDGVRLMQSQMTTDMLKETAKNKRYIDELKTIKESGVSLMESIQNSKIDSSEVVDTYIKCASSYMKLQNPLPEPDKATANAVFDMADILENISKLQELRNNLTTRHHKPLTRLNARVKSLDFEEPKRTELQAEAAAAEFANFSPFVDLTFSDMEYNSLSRYLSFLKPRKVIGNFGDGKGLFYGPRGVTVNQNNQILVADEVNKRVQIFSATGEYCRQIGKVGKASALKRPYDVTVLKNGDIAILDANEIVVFTCHGEFVMSFGRKGRDDGAFKNPQAIECNQDGNIYVVDGGNHRVQVFDDKFEHLFSFGTQGDDEGQFSFPVGIAFNKNGEVIISDSVNQKLLFFSKEGAFLREISDFGSGPFVPAGIKMDEFDNLLVCDEENECIYVLMSDTYLLGFTLTSDTVGTPYDVAFLNDGTLIVSDTDHHKVTMF